MSNPNAPPASGSNARRVDVGRALSASFGPWLLAVLAAFSVCALAEWVGVRIGGSPGYLYGEFRDEGWYGGAMTAASSFLLGAGAVALVMVAALLRHRGSERQEAGAWALAGAVLFALGVDDLLMMHEIAGYRLARAGIPDVLRIGHDNYLLLAYVVVIVAISGKLLRTLRSRARALPPLVLALSLLAGAEILDHLIPAEAIAWSAWLAPVDRVAKTVGAFMVFAFANALLYDVAVERGPVTSPDPRPSVTELSASQPRGRDAGREVDALGRLAGLPR
jgi:hypothetical protein